MQHSGMIILLLSCLIYSQSALEKEDYLTQIPTIKVSQLKPIWTYHAEKSNDLAGEKEMAGLLETIPNPTPEIQSETILEAGKRLYKKHCRSCHGSDLNGRGKNPSLIAINKRYSLDGQRPNSLSFAQLIKEGRLKMPAFKDLKPEEIEALGIYLLDIEQKKDFEFTAPK